MTGLDLLGELGPMTLNGLRISAAAGSRVRRRGRTTKSSPDCLDGGLAGLYLGTTLDEGTTRSALDRGPAAVVNSLLERVGP